ncbi:hypothetical protein SBA1_910047 [Candidatus Sulfotelmatobacter kueseliae]|uniref:Uncharacterized protein n=1 Tax=Candidatus Sulfotelmatobacter kueseliae TaxID=2042962 RepID=A0A2U3LCM5_9BACT|nr:hypothetical protein SBA1_910047 [Candidatus Sulfotelmatobacter kueseliae]
MRDSRNWPDVVPEAPLKVARQFTGGRAANKDHRAVGTAETPNLSNLWSVSTVPPGRDVFGRALYPALKGRATLRRPSGTNSSEREFHR